MNATRHPKVWLVALASTGLVVAAVSCSSRSEPSRKRGAAPGTTDAAPGTADAARRSDSRPARQATPDRNPFPAEVRSLELRRSIAVRFAPAPGSKNLGTVARNTRVGYQQAVSGDGCDERWIEIEPRGWVCEGFLRTSTKRPSGVELPRLDRGQLVPGVFGKVITEGAVAYRRDGDALVVARVLDGSVTVRKYDEYEVVASPDAPASAPQPPPVGDAGPVAPAPGTPAPPGLYWGIGNHEYVAASSLREHEPSRFHGVRLGDDTGRALPLGFVLGANNPAHRVKSYSSATGGSVVHKLSARSAHPILEVARAGDKVTGYRIGEREWVRAAEMRTAELTAPPPRTEEQERWFDIDLDQQTLVAYEGSRPVYATLISSGAGRHRTPTGIYRIWVKFSETDMSGEMADDQSYSVATVPWTQYYAKDFALHTAYWHDGFGTRRSHGCVNLSPIDARFLYFWSWPDVPPGWSMAHGVVERPGSMVRVRSHSDPEPEFQGYAKRVDELRK